MRTSESLSVGETYSRNALRERFGISDKTIDTGIFQPAGHDSVWLFVTRDKGSGMTPYVDELDGDILHWEGQTAGAKDRLIIEHEARGLELLLFYRASRNEYPGYAFRYEGRFRYLNHSRARPTRFTLARVTSESADTRRTEDPDSERNGNTAATGAGEEATEATQGTDLVQRVFHLRKSAQHAVVSEAGRTELQRRMHARDAIEDWLLATIDEWRGDASGPSLIVLSGNAGDGKSDLLGRLLEGVGAADDIACIPDATQADEPSEDQQDRLRGFFRPFADDAAGGDRRLHLIAMNTGMVISFFDRLALGETNESFRQLESILKFELGLRAAGPEQPPWNYAVVNLDRRDLLAGSPSLFAGMLSRLDPDDASGVFGGDQARCATCSARDFCFVRTNLELLRRPDVRMNLTDWLHEASLQEDVHLSPRIAWDFLSRAVAGDAAFFDAFGGASCNAIAALAELPPAESVPAVHRRLLWHTTFDDLSRGEDALSNSLAAVDPVHRGGRHAHDTESAIYAGSASERDSLQRIAGGGVGGADGADEVLGMVARALEDPEIFEICRDDLVRGVTRRAALLGQPGALRDELRDPDVDAFLAVLEAYGSWGGGPAPPALIAFTEQVLHAGVAGIFGVPVKTETYFRLDSFAPTTAYPAFVEVDMNVVEPVPDEDVKRGREWLDVVGYRPRAVVVSVAADGDPSAGGKYFKVDLALFKLLRRVVQGYSASSVDLESFYALRFACDRLGGAHAEAREIVFREAASGRFFSLRERRVLGNDVLTFEPLV